MKFYIQDMVQGFDSRSLFSLPNFDLVKSAKNFGVDNGSSVHIDNNKNDIIILHKGRTQVLNDTTIAVEAEYSTDF